MKINKLKINSYGKLKEKEINLKNGINIIYGQNESGKSTLIKFIINSFFGISKNKNGKELSDYDKYKPWQGEEFSGKIEYELDNKKKFEIYRDFNKKNPKIFNENMEDISKEFNIDKSKGNEFFFEQTKIDENLFLSTLAINQNEVRLESQEQNVLIQKIANLAQTGDDSTSFKRVVDRINRRQLDEIGTERSREKPINIIGRNIQRLQEEKQELEKYKNFKYEFEEKENELNDEIINSENENNFLKEIKLLNENEKIENEKIKIKENIKNENLEKINLINNSLNEIKNNNKIILEKYSENNLKNKKIKNKLNNKKNKLIKILNIIFILLILINIFQFILIKNNIFRYIFLLTVPTFLIFYIFLINKENKKIKNKEIIEKNNFEKINLELINLENQKKLIENNLNNLNEELNKLKNNFNLKINLEKEKIRNNYLSKLEKNKINNFLNLNNLENINFEIENIQKNINDKKLKLHSLDLDKKNIEPQLDNLSKIEEELVDNNRKMLTFKNLNLSMNLAKEILSDAYEEMKNTVTPKFTENLSMNISKITGGKYNKAMFNETEGLIVELENSDYVPANRMSVGTIDQLYLSLRLSMIDEMSEERVPILLDEAFAFYDDERLKNILIYLNNQFKDRQIIIFTCTNREKEILDKININYNLTIM
ncbi:MAG: AAA family ATPase [Clostridia bacterium]|nr:AAA family ATPase [Clostridia bacterium]